MLSLYCQTQNTLVIICSAEDRFTLNSNKFRMDYNNNNNKKRSHTQLDSRKQVIAFQDRVITINIKEAQHPLK